MANSLFDHKRKSYIEIGTIRFRRIITKAQLHSYNPLAEHWNLVQDPCDYRYSSARYYEHRGKEFDFLKDLIEEF